MKPVLPNEGAEWVSTCPTACPVFPTTDQGGPYSDIGGGGGRTDPLKTQFSPWAEHARKWSRRPSSCVVTKGGSPRPSSPEQGPAADWL